MTLLPSVFIFTHHQPLQPGWFLRTDRGWKVLMSLRPGSFHRAYIDALAGRHLHGNYDASAAFTLLARPDYDEYVADVREQLAAFEARFGMKIDAGVGGYHDVSRWDRITQHGTLQHSIWQCRRPLLADDIFPTVSRPARPLVRCMILDGAGSCRPLSTMARCCMVEQEWWPISCESRADYSTMFMDPSNAGHPQYTQLATARITAGLWQTLRANGHTDHTILPDSSVWTDVERAAWEAQGIRVALGPDAIAAVPDTATPGGGQ